MPFWIAKRSAKAVWKRVPWTMVWAVSVWLVKKGRDEEALKTLSNLRNLPVEHELIQIEFLEIKAEALFERRAFEKNFPNLAAKEAGSVWVREFAQYYQIVRTWDNFKRVSTAWLVMFFQQWSGIDAIIYYVSGLSP